MRKLLLGSLFFAATLAAMNASAQTSALPEVPTVTSPRLYVLDCGTLVYNKPESYNLTREEVKDSNMPVTCYLVIHPRGILLFDTGLNDSLVGRPLYENIYKGYAQVKFNTLKGQLADLGVTPDKVNYLMLSHGHFDHVGNANDYKSAQWLVYEKERTAMFSEDAKKIFAYRNYAELENSRQRIITHEHDVFGDGSVVTIPTPGHTDGHYSLKVNLKKTGTVVLSGDLYHYEEERTLDRMPEREKHTGTPASRDKVEQTLKRDGGALWIGHSMEFFKKVRKSPAWYE